MKSDPRTEELKNALTPLGKVHIAEETKDEVSVVVDKPVDIQAVDDALLSVLTAEPFDRMERQESWHIRVLKRERDRPQDLRYDAVRVVDSYYEYRPRV